MIQPDTPIPPLEPKPSPWPAFRDRLITAATPILVTLLITLLTLAWTWADKKIDELKRGQQDAKQVAEVAVEKAEIAATKAEKVEAVTSKTLALTSGEKADIERARETAPALNKQAATQASP
jgi:hypothetical protein